MTTRIRLILFFFCHLLFLSSCSKLFFGPDPQNTPIENFEYLSRVVEERYSLFETKNLDWPSIREKYRQQLRDSMTQEALFELLGDLINELEDGHVNIYTDWDYSRNWDWYLDYPSNFDFDLVERRYLGKKHWRSGPFFHEIRDSIGYIYYGSFATPIPKKSLDAVLDRMQGCKGLVFDIRNNGGGKLNNVRMIASRFADTVRVPLRFQFKSGPAPNAFSDTFEYRVKPIKSRTFTKPVVILINRKSYSAATFFPALMSAYPHVTLMGDTSGGGGGIPYHFELPNGWKFRISTTRTIDAEGRDIEKGIPPDVPVSLHATSSEDGLDPIIEAAFDYIRKLGSGISAQ